MMKLCFSMNTNSINKWIFFLSLFSASCFAQTETETQPQSHERIYQVELIVFSRAEATPHESWPTAIKLRYPDNLVTLKTDTALGENFSFLSANERSLNSQAATLARSGSYSLLYHQAWRQLISGSNTHIFITGGKLFGGHYELEGTISLSVAQYLRIQTNLWLTQFVPADPVLPNDWPPLPKLPDEAINTLEKNEFAIKRIVKLDQNRIMRSNEIHYIDHPLLSVIVKITPY
jgi:Peptidoglycan-binding protein, CsiV